MRYLIILLILGCGKETIIPQPDIKDRWMVYSRDTTLLIESVTTTSSFVRYLKIAEIGKIDTFIEYKNKGEQYFRRFKSPDRNFIVIRKNDSLVFQGDIIEYTINVKK